MTLTNPRPAARSRWGWAFITALCACTALYVGGGVSRGRQSHSDTALYILLVISPYKMYRVTSE